MIINLKNKENKGFTLIEILTSIAIVGIVIAVMARFQGDIFFLSSVAKSSISSAQDTRHIVRTMAKEMRSMSQSNNGAYSLFNVGTSTVTFYSDIDGDGLKEQVRYFVQNKVLKKGVIVPTGNPYTYTGSEKVSILVNDIKNDNSTPIFEFYDRNYDGTSAPISSPVNVALVRLIKISLVVDADVNRSPIQKTYTSQVSLRNLKDNL